MRDGEKKVLRQRIRRDRAQRQDRAEVAAGLARALANAPVGSATIVGYLCLPSEPDLGDCLADVYRAGRRVLVPRTAGPGRLEFLPWEPGIPLGRDRHGFPVPLGDPVAAPVSPETLLLIPALAVDHEGIRLGQGAGYYDRFLADLPRHPVGPLRAAVVHPEELVSGPLPREPHDEPVDAALTPTGWVPLG